MTIFVVMLVIMFASMSASDYLKAEKYDDVIGIKLVFFAISSSALAYNIYYIAMRILE